MNWDHFNMWLYGVISALITGIVILIRKVFTNEKQLELLRQQLNFQHENRKEWESKFEDALLEVRDDIKTILRGGN